MKGKLFILVLLVVSLVVSGCTVDDMLVYWGWTSDCQHLESFYNLAWNCQVWLMINDGDITNQDIQEKAGGRTSYTIEDLNSTEPTATPTPIPPPEYDPINFPTPTPVTFNSPLPTPTPNIFYMPDVNDYLDFLDGYLK